MYPILPCSLSFFSSCKGELRNCRGGMVMVVMMMMITFLRYYEVCTTTVLCRTALCGRIYPYAQ